MDLTSVFTDRCEVILYKGQWIYPIFKCGWSGFQYAKEESKYDEEMKSMQTKVEELSRNHDVQLKKLQDNLTQLHEKYQKMEEGKNAEIQRAVNAKTVGLPLVAASRCRMKRAKAHTFARNI